MVQGHLELIAAEAKVAAEKYRDHKYWPGELESALSRIIALAREALQAEAQRGH